VSVRSGPVARRTGKHRRVETRRYLTLGSRGFNPGSLGLQAQRPAVPPGALVLPAPTTPRRRLGIPGTMCIVGTAQDLAGTAQGLVGAWLAKPTFKGGSGKPDPYDSGHGFYLMAGSPLGPTTAPTTHRCNSTLRAWSNLRGAHSGVRSSKDASGSGANWAEGTKSDSEEGLGTVESRLMFEGTVTATDMDRASDAREKERMGIFGTVHSYAGSSGRVTSESIGRDLNPLGRGDGMAYVGGDQRYGMISPQLPHSKREGGYGNSVNNFGLLDLIINGTPVSLPIKLLFPEDLHAWLVQPCYALWASHLWFYMQSVPTACAHGPWYEGYCGDPCSGQDFLADPLYCAQQYCYTRFLRHAGVCLNYRSGWWDYSHECYPYNHWGPGGVCIRCIHCERNIKGSGKKGGKQVSQLPPRSPRITIRIYPWWLPSIEKQNLRWLAEAALGEVIQAIFGDQCIDPCLTAPRGLDLKECVEERLTVGRWTLVLSDLPSGITGKYSPATHAIEVWLPAIRNIGHCGGLASAESVGNVILHELVHKCLHEEGTSISCCYPATAWGDELPMMCQYHCFQNNCVTQDLLHHNRINLNYCGGCCY